MCEPELAETRDAAVERTFSSLVAQTEQRWEALVLLGTFCESSRRGALAYAELDPRFVLVEGGPERRSKARNRALFRAEGEAVVFLDLGDSISAPLLAVLGASLASNVWADCAFCESQKYKTGCSCVDIQWPGELESLSSQFLATDGDILIHSVLIRRSLMRTLGGFDEMLANCEDWDLLQRAANIGARFIGTKKPFAICGSSASNRTIRNKIAEGLKIIANGFTATCFPESTVPGSNLPVTSVEVASSIFVLKCLAEMSINGEQTQREWRELLSMLSQITDLKEHVPAVVRAFFEGLCSAARGNSVELSNLYLGSRGRVSDLLMRVEEGSSGFGLAAQVQLQLELRILEIVSPMSTTVLTRAASVPFDLQAPKSIELPVHIDHVVVNIHAGGEVLSFSESPVIKGIPLLDPAVMVLRSVPVTTIIPKARLISGLSFWGKGLWICVGGFHELVNQVRQKGVVSTVRLIVAAAAFAQFSIQKISGPQNISGHKVGPSKRLMDSSDEFIKSVSSIVYERGEAGDHCLAQAITNVPIVLYVGTQACERFVDPDEAMTEDGLCAHMQWLKKQSYSSISAQELRGKIKYLENGYHKPIIIAAVSETVEYCEIVSGILKRFGFDGIVLIPEDVITNIQRGDSSSASVSRERMHDLAAAGTQFGIYIGRDEQPDSRGSEQLFSALVQSKSILEQLAGCRVDYFAAPSGNSCRRLSVLGKQAGYTFGIIAGERAALVSDEALCLPRITIREGIPIQAFRRLVDPQGNCCDCVSVVIPAWNAEQTISETLRSVRAQTHTNLDIIIVDDGSKDGTAELVLAHAKVDPRVRLLRQRNKGVAEARNHGARNSKGRFLAFVDADDLWAAEKVAKQLTALNAFGPETKVVYTWSAVIDQDGQITGIHRATASGNVLELMCASNFICNGSAVLLTREAFTAVGGFDTSFFEEGVQGCEDWQFYIDLASKFRFAVVPEPLTGYRRTDGAMSANLLRMLRSSESLANRLRKREPRLSLSITRGHTYFGGYLLTRALSEGQLSVAREVLRSISSRGFFFGVWAAARVLMSSISNRRVPFNKGKFRIGVPFQ